MRWLVVANDCWGNLSVYSSLTAAINGAKEIARTGKRASIFEETNEVTPGEPYVRTL